MKKSNQFDAYAFSVQTERVVIDGDAYFRATAQEFPHLEVYEETQSSAYEVLIQSIQDLRAAAVADSRPFPVPNQPADESGCSGRVTLRISKAIHRRLLSQAQSNGVSLNTEIVTQLSETSVMHELVSQVISHTSPTPMRGGLPQKWVLPSISGGEHSKVVEVSIDLKSAGNIPTNFYSMSGSSPANSKFLCDDPSFLDEMVVRRMTVQNTGS